MTETLRYITNEQGERVGVLLDWEAYRLLTEQLPSDADLLVGLSQAELQALAESTLAPAAQAHLDDLLTRNAETQLPAAEQAELDQLLEQVDHLTLLKTRARYTLKQQPSLATTP